jgi:hypothetical protein
MLAFTRAAMRCRSLKRDAYALLTPSARVTLAASAARRYADVAIHVSRDFSQFFDAAFAAAAFAIAAFSRQLFSFTPPFLHSPLAATAIYFHRRAAPMSA